MTTLTGTEKQIAYAQAIKSDILNRMEKYNSVKFGKMLVASGQTLETSITHLKSVNAIQKDIKQVTDAFAAIGRIERINNQTSAKWIIENCERFASTGLELF